MKLVKALVITLIASFALGSLNINAFVSDVVSFSNWQLPSWKGSITTAHKEKNTYGGQVIYTIGTYFDRDVQYKINDHEGYGSTNWRTISVNGKNIVTRINANTTANTPVLFAGTKSLSMRTASNWLSSTSYSGSWWLSESDYNNYY